MQTINGNVVQGPLSENYLTQNLLHEIFWTQNIMIYGNTYIYLCNINYASFMATPI